MSNSTTKQTVTKKVVSKKTGLASRASKYIDMSGDEIGHILLRPDMYVGSKTPETTVQYVAELTDGAFSIVSKSISAPPALIQVLYEALSNAVDNVSRSQKTTTPCKNIKITLNRDTGETSIWNDGLCIPIEKNDDGEYVHTTIFGKLRTSENYDDNEDRKVSGRNGFGVKLLNVFSTKFAVEGVDPEVGQKLVQTWSKNMRNTTGPRVAKSSLVKGYTKVSFIPDFSQFGLTGYTDDILSVYMKFIVDAAMLTGVNVYFNDLKVPVSSMVDYANMYLPTPADEILHLKTPSTTVVLVPSPSRHFECISFVNGVYTKLGGVHVDAWTEALFRPLLTKFNKKGRPQINMKDIKQLYMLFVSSTVSNPAFESQSKHCLKSPSMQVSVPPKHIKTILSWSVTSEIEDIIIGKEFALLKKNESKKRGYTKVEKLDPANKAGTKDSHKCILILCEGDSAKTYATTGIETGVYGLEGRDWFGILPLRGKPINCRNAKVDSIAKNKEITSVVNALGLRYDVDYSDDKNFQTLKYGKIMILADADVDGLHICGLIVNSLQTLFPSLFLRSEPFVIQMNTPIAKVPKLKRDFYDEREYNKFMLETNNAHESKYYKGLGASSRQEVADTFGQKITEFDFDKDALNNLKKVFHKDQSDQRKSWLSQYDPNTYEKFDNGPGITRMSVSDFLNHYMIQFSIADCDRSIPNVMDGFKTSQRKVLYGCLLRNQKKDIKVSDLQGYISADTRYHHGNTSLEGTITHMAACYTGGNNLPLLARSGEAGSRLQGGGDAASSRYLQTHLEEIVRTIFSVHDDPLLEPHIDDGKAVEPVHYVPCVPMVLVNPTKAAIGTGWAATVPAFNPFDICDCVETWIEKDGNIRDEDGNCVFPELVPWYRGFKGAIEKSGVNKYTTTGIVERIGDNKTLVTELPIGRWTEDFQEYLKDLKSEGLIKGYTAKHTTTDVWFEITEKPDGMDCDNIKNLKLTTTLNTNNLVFFDKNEKIVKFDTVHDVIDYFCKVKYQFMNKRKEHMLNKLKRELTIAENKKRFIEEIITKALVIFQVPEKDVIASLDKRGYTRVDDKYDYLLGMHMRSFTSNKIADLEKEISKVQAAISDLTNTTEKTLWLRDLKAFREAYTNMLVKLEKELSVSSKKKGKKTVKTVKPRVVKKV